jgi:hypothetical protein
LSQSSVGNVKQIIYVVRMPVLKTYDTALSNLF